MKRKMQILAAAALLGVSTGASAFWGNWGGYGWNPYDPWDPRYWMEEFFGGGYYGGGPWGYGGPWGHYGRPWGYGYPYYGGYYGAPWAYGYRHPIAVQGPKVAKQDAKKTK